jgi:DNA polymerase-4
VTFKPAGPGASRPRRRDPLRTILHVDLDAFFAAVEQRDHPELRGRPVVVGMGGKGDRGVVSAASYEARKFGVHSALPIRTAKRLCPDCVFVPVDGATYQRVSREVMAILRRFTPLVEPVSIDEAFLDVTASRALFGDGEAIARRIKATIREELELTVSVGVGTTKLVAKIGSDLRKPDGLVVVPPGDEAAFLAPLPISRLWGVGPSTAAALRDFGVTTIGDLAAMDRAALVRRFGKHGASLVDRAHGRDADPVDDPDAAKTIGHETTFDQDTSDPDVLERTLLALAEGVSGRLRSAGVKAGTVTVKVRDTSFHTITRQRSLLEPTDLTEPIWRAAVELARPEVRGKKIRLLGVTASALGEREQLGLFETLDPRRRQAVEAADELRRRFGPRAVTRARLIRAGLPAPFERDFGTAAERRGDLAADIKRSGRKRPTPDAGLAPGDDADVDIDAPTPDVDDLGDMPDGA